MSRRARPAVLCLVMALGWAAPVRSQARNDWRDFQATWSASGRRHAMTLEDGATAAIIDLSGAVVITGGAGMGRGFRGEIIGFDDGEGMSVGRAVWTDERGDRIFSRLTGDAIAGGRRITAVVTGGTGRYAGIEGSFTFTWKYIVAEDGDRLQGRADDLTGRVRRAGTSR